MVTEVYADSVGASLEGCEAVRQPLDLFDDRFQAFGNLIASECESSRTSWYCTSVNREWIHYVTERAEPILISFYV